MFKRFFLLPLVFLIAIALSMTSSHPSPQLWYPPNVMPISQTTGIPKAPPRIERGGEEEGKYLTIEELRKGGEALNLGERAFQAEFAAGSADDPKGRDRWFWEQRAYPKGFIPADVHNAAVRRELAIRPRAVYTAQWESLGPAPLNDITYGGYSSQDASGRALSVAVHPSNSNIIFVGAAQGGIWKSTDGGATFTAVADGMPSLAIKVIRFAPSNPNIMYAGTGEPHSSTSIYGQGVLKSTDGGDTWTQLPSKGSGWDFEYASVSGLQVHPTDPNIVYVTTAAIRTVVNHFNPAQAPQTGIFKSTDGGQTWTLLKAATEYTSYQSGNVGFMDLELAKSNPNLLYASEYFGGIWKSTDGGATWTRITPMKDTVNNQGADFPATVSNYYYLNAGYQRDYQFYLLNRFALRSDWPEFSRIELGLAQSDPNVLYAGYAVDYLLLDADGDGTFDAQKDIITQVGLLFKTTDGGNTWTWLGDEPRNGPPNYCGTQCSYDNTVEVNPSNANDVIIGGNANYNPIWPDPLLNPTRYLGRPWHGMVYRSLSGGTNWIDITPHCTNQSSTPDGTYNGLPYYPCLTNNANQVIHPDVHSGVFDPNNANRLYITNDGGLYRATINGTGSNSTDYTWANLNNNLSTLQFYFFDAHPTDANKILGGLQDNAVAYWDGSTWEGWGFGDGIFGAFDPNAPQHVYMGTQFNVHRHDNGGAKQALDANGQPVNGWKLSIFKVDKGDSPGFIVPFEIDPVNSSTVYAASTTGLYKSTDRGDTWSNRLNANPFDGTPTTISVSPKNNNYVWVGTSAGQVYLFNFTTDQYGAVGNALPSRYITKIEASPNNANTVYVTFSGYNANTPTEPGKVFKSTDLGQTWNNISGNLPDVPVSALAIDPADENHIWIGSDVGVYETKDGGTTWASYRRNMPVVAIMDLKYNATTGYLMAATHGRGMWRIRPAMDNFKPTDFLYLPIALKDSSGPPSPTPTPTGPTSTPTNTPTPTPTGATSTPTNTSTPTPTATGASTATPTNTPTPTPTATSTPTPTTTLPTVVNGDFESGPGVGWTESSTNNATLICNDASCTFPAGFTPRSGTYVAWLGGLDNETSVLSQTFTIPSGLTSVYFSYYFQVRSTETACAYDFIEVLADTKRLDGTYLCFDLTTWTAVSYDMSTYAGSNVTIYFRLTTDAANTSSFFIDDVSFTSAPLRKAVDGVGMKPR